mmetsp:Transcript_62355/g.146501  ORF Transcript_62355/g.146501 Transcript_62355/m.146501 type:complete len:236 (-) Transcript_62355:1504-2211(-)
MATLEEEGEEIAGADEGLDRRPQALRHSGDEVEGADDELVLHHERAPLRLGNKRVFDEAFAPRIHALRVWQEPFTEGHHYRGEALEERKQVLVVVGRGLPLGNEGREQERNVLRPVQLLPDGLRQCTGRVVEDNGVPRLVPRKDLGVDLEDRGDKPDEESLGGLLEHGHRAHRRFLYLLGGLEHAFEEAVHEGFEEGGEDSSLRLLRRGSLAADPARVAAQGPARHAPYQRLLVP